MNYIIPFLILVFSLLLFYVVRLTPSPSTPKLEIGFQAIEPSQPKSDFTEFSSSEPLVPVEFWNKSFPSSKVQYSFSEVLQDVPTIDSIAKQTGLPKEEIIRNIGTVKQNLLDITTLNIDSVRKAEADPKQPLARFGINKFIIYTTEEVTKLYTGLIYPKGEIEEMGVGAAQPVNLPACDDLSNITTYSWGTTDNDLGANVMPATINQGQCGSCWACSSTTVISAQIARSQLLKSKSIERITKISVSEALNCAKGQKCNGGFPANVYEYYAKIGSAQTAVFSPYVPMALARRCKPCKDNKAIANDPSKCVKFNITNGFGFQDDGLLYSDTNISNIENLRTTSLLTPSPDLACRIKQALKAYGPFSICIASEATPGFQKYTKGIIPLANGEPDHAVVLTGFGKDGNGNEYWIIKNSWGSDWPNLEMDGYFHADMKTSHLGGISTVLVDG